MTQIDLNEIRSAKYSERAQWTDVSEPCVLCGKPVQKSITPKYVVLSTDLGAIVLPDTEPNGGAFLIGSDCAKTPKLKGYVITDKSAQNGVIEMFTEITAEDFFRLTGKNTEQNDLERANCTEVG